MAYSIDGQRVAIAGTVTNVTTEEGMPQVLVRITQAPEAFGSRLLDILEAELAYHPHLMVSYQRLFAGRPVTTDTLKTVQIVLDAFERNHWLVTPRLDQTMTGGDGHYCFFDLPPGFYGLTATLSVPNGCYGSTQGRVEVRQTTQRLAFSELDLALSLVPVQFSIPTQIEHLTFTQANANLARSAILSGRP